MADTALPKRVRDLAGRRFGKIVVLSFAELRPTTGARWLCRCDCGTEKVMPAAGLTRAAKAVRSCGCTAAEHSRKLFEENHAAAMQKYIYRAYVRNARNRNIGWDLSEGTVARLTQDDCFYCKAPPSNEFTHPTSRTTLLYNGIDRVENSVGYQDDNVVPCCHRCNYAKRGMSSREFLIWVHQVARFTEEPRFEVSDLTDRDLSRHPVLPDVVALYRD